jgi:hypothetical protein
MFTQGRCRHTVYGRVAPEAPCKAAWRRHRRCRCILCRRQPAVQGAYGATHRYMMYASHRCANNHRLIRWRITELCGAQWRRRRRRCREDGMFWGLRQTGVQRRRNTLTPPTSAPGARARRLWGDAPANDMPATSSRKHSPLHIMAHHRTLRRAMASASRKDRVFRGYGPHE